MNDEIQRTEVIGQRIEKLYCTSKVVDGISSTPIYFVLANGLVFVPPMPGHPWVRETLPFRRSRFDFGYDPIRGHCITGIYGEMDGEGPDSESCLIRLDDGRWISPCMYVPQGIPSTGLRIIPHEDIDEGRLCDLWELGTPYR